MKNLTCKKFIEKLPKAELHVHIEGTMEPSQLLLFAERNKIVLTSKNVDMLGKKYTFPDLTSFVKMYLQVAQVLCTEQDFYDLTYAYLQKVWTQGVLHTEIFFDIQTYIPRGISPATIIHGMHSALLDGERDFGISGFLIMCFIRHLSEQDAFKALAIMRDYRDKIIGIGLASVEDGNPPSKFERVFKQAKIEGYRLVAHAGEKLHGSQMVRQALALLHLDRIDHGVGCIDDLSLIQELAMKKIPLTVCPLSNAAFSNFGSLEQHPLKKLYDAGLMVTINSDDPAFFGGYVAENYYAAADGIGLSCHDLVACARNSFQASFLNEPEKAKLLSILDAYVAGHACL